MITNSRTTQLRALMKAHEMKAKDVGAILGRDAQTVRSWRSRSDDRVIPAHMLELLKAKLAAKQAA